MKVASQSVSRLVGLLLTAVSVPAVAQDLTIAPTTILGITGSGYDAARVGLPAVVNTGSGYAMLFYAMPFANNIQIGLATSSDGINWTKSPASPVINNGNVPSWGSFREVPRTLMYENGMYKAWFNADNNGLNSMGYATSNDGLSWSVNPNPIRTQDGWFLGVAKLNNIYHGYYMTNGNSTLNEATSIDGINFSGDQVVSSMSGYQLLSVATETVNGQQEIISTWGPNGVGTHVYATSLDGLNFSIGGLINVVGTNFEEDAILPENGLWRIYGTTSLLTNNWCCGNTVIDYATADDPLLATPEPASWLVLSVALIGIGRGRQRRSVPETV